MLLYDWIKKITTLLNLPYGSAELCEISQESEISLLLVQVLHCKVSSVLFIMYNSSWSQENKDQLYRDYSFLGVICDSVKGTNNQMIGYSPTCAHINLHVGYKFYVLNLLMNNNEIGLSFNNNCL